MTNPADIPGEAVDNLLNPTDFQKFLAKDQGWFLGAAGQTIRDHCQWHLYPQRVVTGVGARVGANGIIMLRTLNLISVQNVYWRGMAIPADELEPHRAGWVQWHTFRRTISQASMVPFNLYPARGSWVTVDFTHGYDEMPVTVAEVGYELASRTMQKPAGIVSDMTRGPIRMKFNEFGAVLSDDQKDRLGPYTLPGVG